MANWQPFRYADFHDIPRWIYTTDGRRAFVLDCPFDEGLDDYPGIFTVYDAPVLAWPATRREPWAGPVPEQLRRLGTVEVERTHLDPTLRERIDWDVLAAFLQP